MIPVIGLELTLANLTSELEEVTESYMLGINLGVPHYKLRELETNFPKDARRCKSGAIEYWLDNEHKPSWERIVAALKKMGGYKKLMQTICEKTGMYEYYVMQIL